MRRGPTRRQMLLGILGGFAALLGPGRASGKQAAVPASAPPAAPPPSPPADQHRVTTQVYDAHGRRVSTTDTLASCVTYTYDAGGHLQTSPFGHITTFRYDPGRRKGK